MKNLPVDHGKVHLQGLGVLGETSRVSWDGRKLDYPEATIFLHDRKLVVKDPKSTSLVVEPSGEMCEGD